MISAFSNTFKIPELRNRVLFTLALLVVVRIGAAITCPGVNVTVLQQWFHSQVDTQTGGNVAAAKTIGKLVAERAKEKGIKAVVFDRGGYQYHGRVKALAEAAREAGLEF